MAATPLHVLPVHDRVAHDESEDCPCGPCVVHHSLDGREIREAHRAGQERDAATRRSALTEAADAIEAERAVSTTIQGATPVHAMRAGLAIAANVVRDLASPVAVKEPKP